MTILNLVMDVSVCMHIFCELEQCLVLNRIQSPDTSRINIFPTFTLRHSRKYLDHHKSLHIIIVTRSIGGLCASSVCLQFELIECKTDVKHSYTHFKVGDPCLHLFTSPCANISHISTMWDYVVLSRSLSFCLRYNVMPKSDHIQSNCRSP